MFKNVFAVGNRRFSCALLGLFILMLTALVMFAAVMWKGYADEREWRAMRDELQTHWLAWKQQGINDYSVRYSANNSNFVCQDETLTIINNVINQIPTCAQNPNGYYYAPYGYVSSISDAYALLDDWMLYNRGLHIEIEYHPDLHYITRAEFEDWSGTIRFEYTDLQVAE
jgi:hypothetical protein